jgi:hypothetical protein
LGEDDEEQSDPAGCVSDSHQGWAKADAATRQADRTGGPGGSV